MICTATDSRGKCQKPVYVKEMCRAHYERMKSRGTVELARPWIYMSVDERFWSKVNKTAGCWEWTAGKNNGYGVFFPTKGNTRQAHRYSYEQLVGPIPEGLVIDHLCRNHSCVNPEHLEPVTNQVNLLRGIGFAATKSAQTHCVRGHEFTTENTYVWDNRRYCRKCRAATTARARRAAA